MRRRQRGDLANSASREMCFYAMSGSLLRTRKGSSSGPRCPVISQQFMCYTLIAIGRIHVDAMPARPAQVSGNLQYNAQYVVVERISGVEAAPAQILRK